MLRIITAYLAGILTALSLLASAASLTITTSGAQDARLGPAFGDLLGVRNGSGQPRNATTAEVKDWTIAQYRAVVFAYENRLAQQAIAPPPAFDPT